MIAGLIAAAMLAAPSQSAPIALPEWLAGGWSVQDESGEWWEEWWTPPRAGTMFGVGRSGKGGSLSFWEQMRVVSGPAGVSFCAQPRGEAGTCFKAVSATEDSIVFENPSHDYPTRVAYRRDGADLLAEINGPNGSKVVKWRFKPAN